VRRVKNSKVALKYVLTIFDNRSFWAKPFALPTRKNVPELTRLTQDQIGDVLLIITVDLYKIFNLCRYLQRLKNPSFFDHFKRRSDKT
jgi:hypothetical protein